MNGTVEPVRFANADGCMLHGILHMPETLERKRTAILLLSPGIKMRVAPHRLYNKMADVFVRRGYLVLRFDFYGLGDSEGEVREAMLANLYGSIQVGRYVDDTRCAMQWMTDRYGSNRFILGGLCGGAITGLLAAQSDARVYGLLGLGIPVILDSADINIAAFLTQGQMDRLQRGYASKLINPRAWLRLLTFQSDYRVIWKIVKRKLSRSTSSDRKTSSVGDAEGSSSNNTNPLFARAFFDMVARRRQVLLIFSGSDRLGWEYEEKFVNRHKKELEHFEDWYEVITIPEANHILSARVGQKQMLDLSERWLLRHFAD